MDALRTYTSYRETKCNTSTVLVSCLRRDERLPLRCYMLPSNTMHAFSNITHAVQKEYDSLLRRGVEGLIPSSRRNTKLSNLNTSQSKKLPTWIDWCYRVCSPPSTQLISEQCSHNICIFPISIKLTILCTKCNEALHLSRSRERGSS